MLNASLDIDMHGHGQPLALTSKISVRKWWEERFGERYCGENGGKHAFVCRRPLHPQSSTSRRNHGGRRRPCATPVMLFTMN
jgi:hypothetical protein